MKPLFCAFLFWQPNRDSLSPAGSVRVGYGRPPDCHSLPSALRCPKFLCSLPLREISTAARFTPCLLPPPAADVCRNVIYINFVLRHPRYRLAAALRCPKFLCSLPLREISTAARFTPCLLPPQAADVCQTVIYINFVLRHPMYRLAAALRCQKFLCSLPLSNFRPLHVSRLAFFRHRRQGVKPLSYQNKRALLRSARRIGIRSRLRARSGSALTCHRQVIHSRPVRIPFISKQKSTSAKCSFVLAAE